MIKANSQTLQSTAQVDRVFALAGRRIDAPNTDAGHFPLANVALVKARLMHLLTPKDAALVCSAACGADLLALEVAESVNLRRRIVLPVGVDKFRQSSVLDRPGPWVEVFDRLIRIAKSTGDLMILDGGTPDNEDYLSANRFILSEASSLARRMSAKRITAVVVWEGKSHGPDDATDHFRHLAQERGVELEFVSTV